MKTWLGSLILVGVVAACPASGDQNESKAPVLEESAVNALMERHYTDAIEAHDALVRGDLAPFRAGMKALSTQTLPDAAPAAWRPFNTRLRGFAREGAAAADMGAAAPLIAKVVRTCGECHAQVEAGPEYGMPTPPYAADPLKEKMSLHQWATERLWEGITGPRDEAWTRGADALARSALFQRRADNIHVPPGVLELEAELRALGEGAKRAATADQRAEIYGRLLTTCATCHKDSGALFTTPTPR